MPKTNGKISILIAASSTAVILMVAMLVKCQLMGDFLQENIKLNIVFFL